MIKLPARIRRMPRRRQKIAAKRMIEKIVRSALSQYIGKKNTPELRAEMVDEVYDILLPHPVLHITLVMNHVAGTMECTHYEVTKS